jgi:hypothetical protein
MGVGQVSDLSKASNGFAIENKWLKPTAEP